MVSRKVSVLKLTKYGTYNLVSWKVSTGCFDDAQEIKKGIYPSEPARQNSIRLVYSRCDCS